MRTLIPDLADATLLGGRYRLESLLGAGAFGRVYQAIQVPLGRRVAIKLLAAHSPDISARFAREAALAQRLEHPNTVRILDYGATPTGAPFIVFELLRGKTLADLIAESGPLPSGVALHIASQILKSLMEAHALGIVHRDIKPANVFITSHPGEPTFVKVLDFGIAKDVLAHPASERGQRVSTALSHAPAPSLTATNQMMGTPRYMAPEQAFGDPAGPESDVYAVGLVLAEMIAGRPVYDGDDGLDIAIAQTSAAPVPLPDAVTSSPAGPLTARATQKDRGARYASAADMLSAIEEVLGTSSAPTQTVRMGHARSAAPLTAAPTAVTQHTARPRPAPRRTGLLFGGVALAVAVGAAGGSLLLAPWRDPGPSRATTSAEAHPRLAPPTANALDPFYVPPAPSVDLTGRVPPASSADVEARLRGAGYRVQAMTPVETADYSQWSWAVSRPPCGGSVLLMSHGMESTARKAEELLVSGPGRVLRSGGTLLLVAVVRTTHQTGDADCTNPALDALTRDAAPTTR